MTGIGALMAAGGGDFVNLQGGTTIQSSGAGSPSVSYRLFNSGIEDILRSVAGTLFSRTFFRPAANIGNYEVRATLVSGSLTSGTTGSFLALNTSREWVVQAGPAPATQQAVLTIEIRRIGTTTILATATVDITAERL